jgi:hypothetical protein
VFVVSLSNGAVYEIKSKPSLLFVANLTGSQETPPNSSTATGRASLALSPDEKSARVSLTFSGLSSGQTDAHIHGPAVPGVSAPPVFPLPLGQLSDFSITLTPAQVQDLKNGLFYINVHSTNFPTGEIRGQFASSLSSVSMQFSATSYVVNENAGSVTVSVTRNGNATQPASINYATANGSATQPSDYTSVSGSLQFAPGETVKSFTVPIIDDNLVEGTETINVSLSSPGAGEVEGSPYTTTIVVLDDDKPLILAEELTFRAIALDSVTMVREPFSLVNVHNLSFDQRTRVMFFATGIDLQPGESSSSVQVQIEDTEHHLYPLVVESILPVPDFPFSQIIAKLPDSITVEGDHQLSLTFRGATSNKPLISIVR